MSKHWTVLLGVMAVVAIVIVLLATPPSVQAIPAFSRQYNTSCSTCHVDFPKLNDFGKAFKDAGFKFPTDDESMLKIPPVLLGAPANKELWPHTIWPGSIPGLPPIGLRMNNFFTVVGKNRGNFTGGGVTPPGAGFVPRTDFETGFFSIFTAGNFGSDIAFWVDDDISIAGANGNGGLGDGYLRFVNIGRFLHLPKDALAVRVGQFELDLPFSLARTHNISPWDIYTQANVGTMNALFGQQNVNNAFLFAGAAQGVEFSGGHQYGGYHYSLALVNQNTGGPVDSGAFVPSATGSNNGGVGFFSDSNFKDIYGRFSYRFNLERNAESRHSIQAAGPTGPRDHTYLRLGVYDFYGRSVQRFAGTTGTLTAREPFYRVGGDFDFGYHGVFNLYGLYMYGHDHNLVPLDSGGTPFGTPAVAFIRGVPATFSGGFLQADYLAYPWLMLIMRYDAVNSSADRFNGAGLAGGTLGTGLTPFPANVPFLLPFSNTRNRITPGVQFLIHANIKASFEYQIRPQQSVTVDPATGLPVQPFRTNTVTAGLEFVY